MMTSLKAPNKANAETLDFDNQNLEQTRESASLSVAVVTVLRAAEPCNKKISLNRSTSALEKIPLARIDYAEAISHEVVDAASLRSLLETVSEHPDLAITLCSFNGIPLIVATPSKVNQPGKAWAVNVKLSPTSISDAVVV